MRENLKNARKAAGMTQEQVAESLDISTRYYAHLEALLVFINGYSVRFHKVITTQEKVQRYIEQIGDLHER